MRDIRVATVQFQHAAGDKAYNFGRIRHFVTEAARARVELIAFPEMCLTGYWHVRKLSRAAFEALAEPVPDGPSTRDLLELSREHRMTIGAGLLERASDGGIYNAYVVAMPDGTWAVHRKLHAFEHANISAALTFAVDAGDARLALAISGSLGRYWEFRNHQLEGRRWLEGALELPQPVHDESRWRALYWNCFQSKPSIPLAGIQADTFQWKAS